MQKMLYKTDIFILLLFLMPVSTFFYFLTWKYKPPDLLNSELSKSDMNRIIQELREKKRREPFQFDYRGKDDDIVNKHDRIFAKTMSFIDNQETIMNRYNYDELSFNSVLNGNLNRGEQISKENILLDGSKHEAIPDKTRTLVKLKGGAAQCIIYDIKAEINETYDCIPLKVEPVINICVYPTEEDIHISQHIRNGIVWESHIVKQFQDILATDPGYGFIDIGANIGMYTLVAASNGHMVIAVEPIITNIRHLHQAALLNGLTENITVLRNAVYDEHKNYMHLLPNKDNQGGIMLDPKKINQCIQSSCVYTAKTIFMDDLLEVINFKKAVLKIDIEGFEHRAFRHSELLFQQVYISHIIMEWMQLRAYYGSEMDTSVDKDLTHELVAMLFERGFRPYSLVTGSELKRNYWYAWPDDIIWKNKT